MAIKPLDPAQCNDLSPLLPPTGIPRGLSVHPDGQLAPARPVDAGEVHRLRRVVATVAAFFGLTRRLRDLLRPPKPATDHERRRRDLHDRVLENCPARRW